MVTSEELNATFTKVGNDFHFDEVTAEFAPFRDLKIRWCRTMGHADFSVSDYLEGAPSEAVEGIATTLMSRIRGEGDLNYPDGAVQWLTSHEFRERNQERYIERSRSIGEMDSEDTKMLWESYYRLLDAGLVAGIEDLRLFWSKNDSVSKAGQSSCLMRVVIMNRRLLDPTVPSEVLDYCLLHELANISVAFSAESCERKKMVNEMTDGYAGSDTAKQWLDQVMMSV